MLEGFKNWAKGVLSRVFKRDDFKNANIVAAVSDKMTAQIDRWVNLYYNKAEWLNGNSLTLGLPALLAREISTLVTLEAKINVFGDSERAKLISDILANVSKRLQIQTEYACAFGGLVFKPYISNGKVCIAYVNADDFYPTSFNAMGEITGVIFVERRNIQTKSYTRLERHEMDGNGKYVITNNAFETQGNQTGFGSSIGTPVPLETVPEWATLEPVTEIDHLNTPLFAYFKIPMGNTVDVNSQLGVSVYAKADSTGVLREADKQFQRLVWEFEGGELAVNASIEAFKLDENGKPILPEGKERLYRLNELMQSVGDGGKLSTFSPTLRDESLLNGLNKILMRVEDLCGIAHGTYSDVSQTERTATEIRAGKQRSYATVTAIQMALQGALDELGRAIDALATLYELTPDGEYSITYTWDDSIILDAETEKQSDKEDVRDGLMAKWEYRVKWYGETEEVAKARIAELQPQSTDIDALLAGINGGEE